MKSRVSCQKITALTLLEVLVVIAVLFVLVALFLPTLARNKPQGRSLCVNNLKQIGLAYNIWAGNHNGKFPMQVSVTNWGARELALEGDVAGIFCTTSNDLNTPQVLWCPSDKSRVAAGNFAGLSAKNISYFVGLDAATNHPQIFLSGDDNFVIAKVSVKSGLLAFSTNAPIAFTAERHGNGGNIGLADGSVRAAGLGYSLQQMIMETGAATNRLAIP